MHRNLTAYLVFFTFTIILAACTGSPGSTTNQPGADMLEPTLTSVFEPMLTPTPTPYIDTPPVVVPPSGALPGVAILDLTSGQTITPTLVDFFNPLVGWGVVESSEMNVSGFILRTEDGGVTWQPAGPQPGFPQNSRFFALDELQAWAAPADFRLGESVTTGTVWRTNDGGKTWTASAPADLAIRDEPMDGYNQPVALFFLDAQHGWFVASVGHYMNQDVLVILSTQDGGQTWQRLTDKFAMAREQQQSMPCQVSGIAFVDAQHGFLAGDCLAVGLNDGWSILETMDGGTTWNRLELPEPQGVPDAVRSAAEAGTLTCAATGVELTPAGVLVSQTCQVPEGSGMLKTFPFLALSPDNGQTWRGWAGQTASFVDPANGFSLGALNQAGAREFFTTVNGGVSWQAVSIVAWPEARIDFVSPNEGFVVAAGWNTARNAFDYALVSTRDGGKSWEIVQGKIQ